MSKRVGSNCQLTGNLIKLYSTSLHRNFFIWLLLERIRKYSTLLSNVCASVTRGKYNNVYHQNPLIVSVIYYTYFNLRNGLIINSLMSSGVGIHHQSIGSGTLNQHIPTIAKRPIHIKFPFVLEWIQFSLK